MIDEDERELAAALVVAIEAGLLSIAEAIRVVDREITRRPSPGHWLLEASLIGNPQDLLHALRPVADGHPLLGEIWPLLEAMERSLRNGTDPIKVARLIKRFYPYGSWPTELRQPLYDVYEEATCAHEHGSVPEPQSVQKALLVLFEIGRVCGGQRSALQLTAHHGGRDVLATYLFQNKYER
jgi:hypothetical protein